MEKENNKKTSLFERLAQIDCSGHTEKKKSNNGPELTYLSWSWAWQILKLNCPDATYKVREWDGKPYLFDADLGYLVETELTCEGITMSQRLPVMDGANKAQKNVVYEYATKYGKKQVQSATMFDINTAIQRCLVKNIAMFGLGLNVYAGEDLPISTEDVQVLTTAPAPFSKDDETAMRAMKTEEELCAYCKKRTAEGVSGAGRSQMVALYKQLLAELKTTNK